MLELLLHFCQGIDMNLTKAQKVWEWRYFLFRLLGIDCLRGEMPADVIVLVTACMITLVQHGELILNLKEIVTM